MKQPKTIREWSLWVLQYAWEVTLEFLKLGAIILRSARTKTEDDNLTYLEKKRRYGWKD